MSKPKTLARQVRESRKMTVQHGLFDNGYCATDHHCVVRRQMLRENAKLKG